MSVGSSKDIQVFTGVMDGDTERRRIAPGDYLYLLNARSTITNEQNNSAIEDCEGNMLVGNPYVNMYGGESKCIGSYEDVAGQSIIYFVYNSLGHHGIYRWFLNRPGYPEGVVEKIWQVKDPSIYNEYNKNPLNFHPDYLITGVALVDNLLLWTDYYNEPRQMDIVRANETNKRRRYNFFINKKCLDTGVFYTITIFDSAGVAVGFPVPYYSDKENLFDRVDDLVQQISSVPDIDYIAHNKYNYIELEITKLGEYTIELSDTGFPQSKVLPANFYQSDVGGNYFNRIQAPPFCRPTAYYLPQVIANLINPPEAVIDSYTINISTPSLYSQSAVALGFNSKLNDVNNNIVLGSTKVFPLGAPFVLPVGAPYTQHYTYPEACIFLNGSAGLTLNISFKINVFWSGPGTAPAVGRINMNLISVQPNGDHKFKRIYYIDQTITGTQQTFTIPSVIVDIPGTQENQTAKHYISLGIAYGQLNFYAAKIVLNNISIPTKEAISKQTNMFRAKYIYENFQKSVYGQSTSLILRTENYNSQHEIMLNFEDKFLLDDNHLCRISKCILSKSRDNGTTWYDFKTLDLYDFACEDTRNYIYSGNEQSIPVATSEAILQYHATPLKSNALEYADERIWDGGIVEGYDSVPIKMDIEAFSIDYIDNGYYISGVLPISLEGFRPGYKGFIGIVYYDDFDRKSGVCLSDDPSISIPSYKDRYWFDTNINDNMPVWGIKCKVYNEPPSWATKYRIVRTRDFTQDSYLMWMVAYVDLIDIDGNVTAGFPAPAFFRINLDNLPYYTENSNKGAIIEYTYVQGDRIKIICKENGDFYTDIFDVEIAFADSNNIYIKYDALVTIANGDLIEIYSKGEMENPDTSQFFEFGECMEVGSKYFDGVLKKYHKGNDTSEIDIDQSYSMMPVADKPARLVSLHGGVYFRIRFLYFNTGTLTVPVWAARQFWISSNYADEYSESKSDGLTRANAVIRIGQIALDSAVRFTNTRISGSEINGLNENEPLNLERYSVTYGLVEKMQLVENDVIKLIFRNSYQLSIYVSQGVIRQTQGGGSLISVYDQVAGNSHIIQRTIGSQNAESVALNDEADVMGYDENEGVVWRSSKNGTIVISDYKQKNAFKEWSNRRKLLDRGRSYTPSVYDLYHDEYIITLGGLGDIPNSSPTFDIDILDLEPAEVVQPGITPFSFTVKIEIYPLGVIILPTTQSTGGATLRSMIISAFNNAGWGVEITVGGVIHLTAPNLNYNNSTIDITVQTNDQYVEGTELVRNGEFIYPNSLNDWVPGKNWSINPGGAANQYARYLHINPFFPTKITQKNIGLNVGDLFRIRYKCKITLNNGEGVRFEAGNTTIVSGATQYSNAAVSEDLYYQDAIDDQIGFAPTSTTFQGYIYQVSIKKLYPNPHRVFRYKAKNGFQAEEETEPFTPVTIAFSKKKNGWPQYHSFTPEMYGRLNDNVVSFRDGQLWLHTTKAIPKNYYGVQYGRELIFVSNKDFPKVKEYKALSVNGIGKNAAPIIRIPPYEGVPNGMETELTQAHFETKEGVQYAAIQRDKLTPGAASTDEGWVNGRAMKGQVIEVKLVNNDPDVSLIFNAEILYFYSENS